MQFVAATPATYPVPVTLPVIKPKPPSKWELPQESYPDWSDPQMMDIFRHVVWNMLAPGWGDVFGNHWLSVARSVCRAWYGAFELLSWVHLPGRQGASIMKGDQLDPRIFAIAQGIQFKGSVCLPSARITPNFYAAFLTDVTIRCGSMHISTMLGTVNAFVRYDPPVASDSDPFADAHVARERNVPNLQRLKIFSDGTGEEVAQMLYWIVQGSDIRELSIDELILSEKAMHAIARGLSHCRAIESFSVFARHLTGACLDRMVELPLDRMKSLHLGGSIKDGEDAAAVNSIRTLCRGIARSASMEDLGIGWYLPIDEALVDFEREVRAIYGNDENGCKHPLKRIWIRNALVRDSGAVALATFLQSGHSQLLQLSLVECAIRDAGVKAIVNVLKDDKTLKLVDLSGAPSEDDLELFGLAEQALARNSVLKWLIMKTTILEDRIPFERRKALPRMKFSRWMVPHNYLTDPRWVYGG